MVSDGVNGWRFAPLNPEAGNPSNRPKLSGIVFDVDGTLCESSNLLESKS